MNPIKPNIGTLDRYLRLSAGLIIFGSGVAGRRSSLSRYLLTTLGAAKIAEGITGWCPLMAITGGSTTGTENQSNNKGSMASTRRGENSSTTSSLHQPPEDHSSEESSESPSSATSGERGTDYTADYTARDDSDGKPSRETQDDDDE